MKVYHWATSWAIPGGIFIAVMAAVRRGQVEMTTVDAKVPIILKAVYYLVGSTHFENIQSPSGDKNITSLKLPPSSTWNI